MKEIWKTIKSSNGKYQVSNLGRIRSIYIKILKPTIHQGYMYVSIYNPTYRRISVHRLIAKEFVLNPKNKLTVNHKNGDKTDNRASNLIWQTQQENYSHAIKTGLQKSKINKKIADKIREEYKLKKFNMPQLSKKYNLCVSVIWQIIHYKRWK